MTAQSVEDLTAPMLKKQMFACFSTLVPGHNLAPLLTEHLEYMIALEKDGCIFASGPLCDEEGKLSGDGLTLLRANSVDEAREIANNDPFVKNGVRITVVKPWLLMEGQVSLTVNLSQGTFAFL